MPQILSACDHQLMISALELNHPMYVFPENLIVTFRACIHTPSGQRCQHGSDMLRAQGSCGSFDCFECDRADPCATIKY